MEDGTPAWNIQEGSGQEKYKLTVVIRTHHYTITQLYSTPDRRLLDL